MIEHGAVVAGVREAPRHEIAGTVRCGVRKPYGDLVSPRMPVTDGGSFLLVPGAEFDEGPGGIWWLRSCPNPARHA